MSLIRGLFLFHDPHIATPTWVALLGITAMRPLPAPDAHYLMRFQSLKNKQLALVFPCDAEGRVELDSLSDRARIDYLFARAVVGCEFRRPSVVPA
jgi:hypothetical protein